jgi:hypothetical protein
VVPNIDIPLAVAGLTYPATKEQILDRAAANSASVDTTRVLRTIPDVAYPDSASIVAAVCGEA